MRLLFLSQHYVPEPCDTRTSQLAEALAARGHRCTALTAFPNYPFGKIYDGYRQTPLHIENRNGVQVMRVPILPDHSLSKKKRALSYLSFGFTSGLIGTFRVPCADLMWIHHPPLTTAIAGSIISAIRGIPYVLEIHDLWPETLTSSGMIHEGKVTRAIERVCQGLYRRATLILVTSEGMRRNLIGKGVPANKVEVMHQWANEEVYKPTEADPEFRSEYGFDTKTNIVFAGNLGVAQGLDTILNAASILKERKDIRFHLIGDGAEMARLQERVLWEQLENVKFHGHHPATDMPQFYACADALVIHLKRDPLFEIMIPSKTQAYLASGRPILCGVGGHGNDLIEESGAGLAFEPEDPQSLVDRVLEIANMDPLQRMVLAQTARTVYEERFAKKPMIDRYERLFHRLTGAPISKHALVEVSGVDSETETFEKAA